MKFRLKYLLFPLLLLIFCSFIKNQNKIYSKTEFSETCLKISTEFKKQEEHGGHVYNKRTKKYLSLPKFSEILKNVSKYDIEKNGKYSIEKSNAGKIERIIWKSSIKKTKLISFEKLTFKTIIEQEHQGKKYQNEFIIVDYLITRNETPKKILLRILENEFEKISIDENEYLGVFESRLVGIDEAQSEFNKLLTKK
jgi:hypothetical protein